MINQKLIMVVDDEQSLVVFLKRALTEAGFQVITAEGGRKALQLLEKSKPDLILLDILMPDMDGYTACKHIKTNQLTKTIPVYMLTAVGFDMNRQLATEMGADGYITKPFNYLTLIETINEILKNK